jgi:hypothetical protein
MLNQRIKIKVDLMFVCRVALIVVALSVFLLGCSKPKPKLKEPEVYSVAFRKLPPDPVYNPVRTTHLPQTMPGFLPPEPGPIYLEKNYKISVKNVSLEEVVKGFAASNGYSSYTASTIAKKKVSFNSYGTIDQIAQELASKIGVEVAVDHNNREFRVLEKNADFGDEPKFALQ